MMFVVKSPETAAFSSSSKDSSYSAVTVYPLMLVSLPTSSRHLIAKVDEMGCGIGTNRSKNIPAKTN